jgi:putative colanic acid biosynthesis glycosyltransferase
LVVEFNYRLYTEMAGLISVITVNRDDAPGLRATALSVAAQARPPDEWIVIDGGSTDGSIAVIREFAHLIHCWTSAPDRGVYDGMNWGLRRARGTYVLFMNAGDRFAAPDSLARIADALCASPGLDLLFGGTILALPSGQRLYRPPRSAARLRHGLPAYHQATVIRRAVHLMAPYDLALPISGDYGAIATLVSRGASSTQIGRPIAIRACHPASLSERATARRFADFVRVQRQVLDFGLCRIAIHVTRLALVHFAYRALRRIRIRRHTGDEQRRRIPT